MSIVNNILYIDDNFDLNISKCLRKYFAENYNEKKFDCSMDTYESLLNCEDVKNSDIIVVDSRLFENDKVIGNKFSGEEFKILLKKVFPYKEAVVVSQNDENIQMGILAKYKPNANIAALDYYNKNLLNLIIHLNDVISINKSILSKIEKNDNVDSLIIQKIKNSIDGINEYDELNKDDIDSIISQFKCIEGLLNNE